MIAPFPNLFLIAPFPDRCLLVPFYELLSKFNFGLKTLLHEGVTNV